MRFTPHQDKCIPCVWGDIQLQMQFTISRSIMYRILVAIVLSFGTFTSLLADVPLGRVWERVDEGEGMQPNRVCGAGELIYAVGRGGGIWKTTDRQSWSKEDVFETDVLYGIANGNGTLVAVGTGGRILRKLPGGVWGAQPSGVSWGLRSVTYGAGMFVAVGDGGTVVRSPDGVNWSVWPSGVTGTLYDVIWDGGMFLAVGQGNTILSAPVSGTWTRNAGHVDKGQDYKSIARGAAGYLLDGRMFSHDAGDWLELASPPASRNDVAAGAGVFAVAGNAGQVNVSTDGIVWESIQTCATEDLLSMEWTGTEFVALTATRNLVISEDGYRWTARGLPGSLLNPRDGCWDGARYVVVGEDRLIYTSEDGSWWTTERTPPHGTLLAVCAGGNKLVAVGDESALLHSADGRTWHKVDVAGEWAFHDVTWTGTEFIAVGSNGIVLTSTDAEDWKINNPGLLDAVTWDGGRFLAFSSHNVLSSSDGNDWTCIAKVPWFYTRSDNETMRDIIWTGSFYLAVGDMGWVMRSPDGVTWTRRPMPNLRVTANGFSSVAWSGSRFVATGRQCLAHSADGLDWTFLPLSGIDVHADVAWNGSLFMAVWGSTVRSSPDGINWSVPHTRNNGILNSITWSGSDWVMAGSVSGASFVATSPDGISWNTVTGDAGAEFLSVASRNGVHVAIDRNGKVKRYSSGTWADEASGLEDVPVSLVVTGNGFSAFNGFGMTSSRTDGGPAWTPGYSRTATDTYRTIVAHDGIWVAAGCKPEPIIATSVDGRNWTHEQCPPGYFFSSVWTGTEFQLVGQNGVFTSATGKNWVENIQWSSYDARCIVRYQNQSIIGGAGSGNISYSIWNEDGDGFVGGYDVPGTVLSLVAGPDKVLAIGSIETSVSRDGRSWSLLEPKPSLVTGFSDVIHSPFGFFAAGDGGWVWQSADGETWSRLRVSDTNRFNALAWGNDKLVAVGNGFSYSQDGVRWHASGTSTVGQTFSDVTWGGDRFVAVAPSYAAWSQDGVSWVLVAVPANLNSVVWTGTSFVAGTSDGGVLHSVNGSEWTFEVLPGDVVSITCGNGVWWAATTSGKGYRSLDGTSWTQGFSASQLISSTSRISFVNDRFFCFLPSACYHSTDGLVWTFIPTSRPLLDVAWTGTRFIGVGDAGLTAHSSDGTVWTSSTAGNIGTTTSSVVWTGNEVIRVGAAGSAYASPDGLTWSVLASGTTSALVDVAWTGTQAVALDSGGSLVYFNSGTPLPSGVTGREIHMDGESLVVACDGGNIALLRNGVWSVTNTNSGTAIRSIARNGSRWLAVGNAGTVLGGSGDIFPNDWALEARSARTDNRIGNIVKLTQVMGGPLVSIGSAGNIQSSTTGRIWDQWQPQINNGINALLALDGDLITFGNQGKINRLTPSGGVVAENSGTVLSLRAAASSGSRLVAVGDSGLILVSKTEETTYPRYENWAARQGVTSNWMAPDGDIDSDGVKNIVEYLHGLSSSAANPANETGVLPAIMSPDGADGGRCLTFEIYTGYPDVEITVLRTSDLVTWTEISRKIGAGTWSGTADVSETAGTNGRRRIKVVDSLTNPAAFYKLEVGRR